MNEALRLKLTQICKDVKALIARQEVLNEKITQYNELSKTQLSKPKNKLLKKQNDLETQELSFEMHLSKLQINNKELREEIRKSISDEDEPLILLFYESAAKLFIAYIDADYVSQRFKRNSPIQSPGSEEPDKIKVLSYAFTESIEEREAEFFALEKETSTVIKNYENHPNMQALKNLYAESKIKLKQYLAESKPRNTPTVIREEMRNGEIVKVLPKNFIGERSAIGSLSQAAPTAASSSAAFVQYKDQLVETPKEDLSKKAFVEYDYRITRQYANFTQAKYLEELKKKTSRLLKLIKNDMLSVMDFPKHIEEIKMILALVPFFLKQMKWTDGDKKIEAFKNINDIYEMLDVENLNDTPLNLPEETNKTELSAAEGAALKTGAVSEAILKRAFDQYKHSLYKLNVVRTNPKTKKEKSITLTQCVENLIKIGQEFKLAPNVPEGTSAQEPTNAQGVDSDEMVDERELPPLIPLGATASAAAAVPPSHLMTRSTAPSVVLTKDTKNKKRIRDPISSVAEVPPPASPPVLSLASLSMLYVYNFLSNPNFSPNYTQVTVGQPMSSSTSSMLQTLQQPVYVLPLPLLSPNYNLPALNKTNIDKRARVSPPAASSASAERDSSPSSLYLSQLRLFSPSSSPSPLSNLRGLDTDETKTPNPFLPYGR